MTDSSIARRYAQSLFLIGEERGKTDVYLSQLNSIKEALNATPELAGILTGKLIATEKKKSLIGQIFGGSVETEVQNFLYLIIDKGREDAVFAIIDEFRALSDEKNGVVCAVVHSAAALGEEQLAALKAAIKARTGKEARIETAIDESLIGGVKVKVGDMIFDASVTGQLSALKQQLLS